MFTDVSVVTILVEDQEEALDYYTNTLGFVRTEDVEMEDGGRWVTVAPPGNEQVHLTLVEADTPEKRERVGSQVADHVAVVFETDDCRGTYEELSARGVEFHGEPTERPWGTEVVFEDIYGNVFDLLEFGEMPEAA